MTCRNQRGFSLVELMVTVSIIGILSAAAMPAYSRYIRRSRSVEATMNVRRMFDSTIAYYMTERADVNGVTIAKQFPGVIPWTPILSGCCFDVGQKCNPATLSQNGLCEDPNCFQTLAWQQLNFSIDDPFYFSYGTTATGNGGTTPGDQYHVNASADLECTYTAWSLFDRTLTVNSTYSLQGGAGIFTSAPLD